MTTQFTMTNIPKHSVESFVATRPKALLRLVRSKLRAWALSMWRRKHFNKICSCRKIAFEVIQVILDPERDSVNHMESARSSPWPRKYQNLRSGHPAPGRPSASGVGVPERPDESVWGTVRSPNSSLRSNSVQISMILTTNFAPEKPWWSGEKLGTRGHEWPGYLFRPRSLHVFMLSIPLTMAFRFVYKEFWCW